MEVENVFTDENKFIYSMRYHNFGNVALQKHNVVVKTIVPFTDKFHHGKAFFVISKKNFHVERVRTEVVPLRMYIVIVNGIGINNLAVFSLVKRRTLVLPRHIKLAPIKKRFNVLHATKIQPPQPVSSEKMIGLIFVRKIFYFARRKNHAIFLVSEPGRQHCNTVFRGT